MNSTRQSPKIAVLPNGPCYLIEDPDPAVVPHLERADGAPCATVRGVALCRCGGSRNKPFCDGTHGRIGFKDAKSDERTPSKRERYVGKSITILDDRGVCAHAGFCTEELAAVFRDETEPWIDPDGASVAAIVDIIRKCPSGALSYSIAGAEPDAPAREPKVTVTDDGPYAVTGGIELVGSEFGDGASKEHYTLCRCGNSRNKPFCDGSHWESGFKDPVR